MPKVKAVEKRIWDIEGFDVRFLHEDGRDLRGDCQGLPHYNSFQRAAKNDMTVADWKTNRFRAIYPGFNVEILDGSGNAAQGNMKLGTVRDSYEE